MRNHIIFCILAAVCSVCHVSAKTHSLQRSGFAIVIDSVSLSKADTEVRQYAEQIERQNHLKVYTIVDRWGVPDSIRATLCRLYTCKDNPLCGAVFIGDIPVPMIRDAQYLTSAFKMDQTNPWQDSSVPSDRYYDDFSLKFDFLCRDSVCPRYFYYSLSADGAQTLRPDIFTGRIRPTDAGGSSRYDKLRRYLQKIVEQKKLTHSVGSVFVYTGSGSINESRWAHIGEMHALYEHFPSLATHPDAFRYLDYSSCGNVKTDVMNQLMAPDLDIAVLHHHGDFDTQYLGNLPKTNLVLRDFKEYSFHPECRVVLFDACYNGSFHRDDCIADEYIFQDGACAVAIGGTVNVLQDKWPDRLLGLFAQGVMAGNINRLTCDLEMHVVGDPTYCFSSDNDADVNRLIQGATAKEWVEILDGNSSPDMKCLALNMLRDDSRLSDSRLSDIATHHDAGIVRLEAYLALLHRGSELLRDVTSTAMHDNYELLQRLALNAAIRMGDRQLEGDVAHCVASPYSSPRILFNACQGIQFFPKEEILSALDSCLDRELAHAVCTDSLRKAITAEADKYAGRWKDDILHLCSDSLSERRALLQASFMKIYCPPYLIPQVAEYTKNCKNSVLQRALLSALGWHGEAYTSGYIREAAEKLYKDNSLPEDVRKEALRTLKRITPFAKE